MIGSSGFLLPFTWKQAKPSELKWAKRQLGQEGAALVAECAQGRVLKEVESNNALSCSAPFWFAGPSHNCELEAAAIVKDSHRPQMGHVRRSTGSQTALAGVCKFV